MKHEAGTTIVFVANKATEMNCTPYKKGDSIEIVLRKTWDDQFRIGKGGPWGCGGYTSLHISSIAKTVTRLLNEA